MLRFYSKIPIHDSLQGISGHFLSIYPSSLHLPLLGVLRPHIYRKFKKAQNSFTFLKTAYHLNHNYLYAFMCYGDETLKVQKPLLNALLI